MNEPWHLRHEYDERVKVSVFDQNEYHLPDTLTGWVVLDIGGNIGAFTRLAAERGATVHAYEPCPKNAGLFLANTRHLGDRITLHEVAILGDCGPTGQTERLLTPSNDPAGTSLFRGDSTLAFKVPVVSIARAVEAAGGTVDLCKIDAEGAEYDILENGDLSGIRRLAVEFHGGYVGRPEYRAEALRASLADQGFTETCWEATHPHLGWYRLYKGER